MWEAGGLFVSFILWSWCTTHDTWGVGIFLG